MKNIFALLFILIATHLFAQDSFDSKKYKDCELWPTEEGRFDMEKRVEEMKALDGTEVIVYEFKRKDMSVKKIYSGFISSSEINTNNKLEMMSQATSLKLIDVKSSLGEIHQKGKGSSSTAYVGYTSKLVKVYLKGCFDKVE